MQPTLNTGDKRLSYCCKFIKEDRERWQGKYSKRERGRNIVNLKYIKSEDPGVIVRDNE